MNSAHVFGNHGEVPSIGNITPMVFVVDEDIPARNSLTALIRCKGLQVETFQSAREFLARPRALVPSCLILALSASNLNGFEVQRQIARERPETPIIVISGYGDAPIAVEAMKAGAVDVVLKPFSNHVLLRAIRQIFERSRVAVNREMKMRVLRNRYASLTLRERQVMDLVVAGMLNKQAGGELGITEKTVKAHRGQIMQKMKANSFADLVRMAAELEPAREAA